MSEIAQSRLKYIPNMHQWKYNENGTCTKRQQFILLSSPQNSNHYQHGYVRYNCSRLIITKYESLLSRSSGGNFLSLEGTSICQILFKLSPTNRHSFVGIVLPFISFFPPIFYQLFFSFLMKYWYAIYLLLPL